MEVISHEPVFGGRGMFFKEVLRTLKWWGGEPMPRASTGMLIGAVMAVVVGITILLVLHFGNGKGL